jgi:integrase
VDEKLTKAKADRDVGLVFDVDDLKLEGGPIPDPVAGRQCESTVTHTTYESYERLVRKHLVPTLGRLKLKICTPAHVRGLYREKLDSGLSATSV